MTENLRILGRKWLQELKEIACEGGRAGEISLSEKHVRKLSRELSSVVESAPYFDPENAASLTVVTVNLAYYYYEGSGSDSFLRYINVNQEFNIRELIGPRIERFLIDIKMIAGPRTGAWRYVGLILRQAIVTKHYKESLKFYLKKLDNLVGLEKFEHMSFGNYLEKIDFLLTHQRFTSGIFTETLRTREGFRLVQTVTALLDQVRLGTRCMDELKSLPGFREGFWEGLETILEESLGVLPVRRYRKPIFVYNPEQNRVGVLFDERGVRDSLYTLNLAGTMQRVERAFVPIMHENDLLTELTVVLRTGEEFPLNAWQPEVGPKPVFQALFNQEDGRLASSINDPGTRLAQGAYYLIASCDIDEHSLNRMGMGLADPYELDLEGEQYYSVWSVQMAPGMTIPDLGKCDENAYNFGLSWENPRFLKGVNRPLHAFAGTMPLCRVRGWERLKNRYRLVTEVQGKRTIVGANELAADGLDAVFSLKPTFERAGCIKLELAGHTVLRPEPTELRFLLLPAQTTIRWSYGLLGHSETPKVTVSSRSDLKLQWNEEPEVTRQNRQTTFTFPAGTECVHAKSQVFEDLSISIWFYIAQVYPVTPPSPSTRVLLWSSSLEKDCSFIIRGHRDTPLELAIKWLDTVYPVWQDTDGRKFKAKITSMDLRDGVPSARVLAGEFVVKFKNAWKKSGCVYLSEEGVKHSLLKKDDRFMGYLPHELQEIFQGAMQVITTPGTQFQVNCLAELPQSLKLFLLFLEAGTVVFDHQKPLDLGNVKYSSIPYFSWLKWFEESIREMTDPYRLFSAKPQGRDLPPLRRWREKIRKLVEKLSDIVNLRKVLSEWGKDLNDPYGAPTSQIAILEMGHNLTRAGYHYKNRNYQEAYNISKRVLEAGAPTPVLQLTSILAVLSLVRLWRFREPFLTERTTQPWDVLCHTIDRFQCLFNNGHVDFADQKSGIFSDALRLLELLGENCFRDLLRCIANRRWERVKEMARAEPLIMYMIYRNKDLQERTLLSPNNIRFHLIREQNARRVPLRIELN